MCLSHHYISQFLIQTLIALCLGLCLHEAVGDSLNNGFDHRAHAVPGGPYRQMDTTGSGSAMVRLNAELSHSHYFDARSGLTGRIVKYVWQIAETGRVICRRVACNTRFRVGVTRVRLTVRDNTGDDATATTKVFVYDGKQRGLRLLFYYGNGWVPKPLAATVPTLSRTKACLNMYGRAAFPPGMLDDKLSVRVLGYIKMPVTGGYRFRLTCGGATCVFRVASRLVLRGGFGNVKSKRMYFRTGIYHMHIIYRREFKHARNPSLVLRWRKPNDGKRYTVVPKYVLSHRPSLYRPLVHHVVPPSARVGTIIHIYGSSFINVRAVRIGGVPCTGPVARTQFMIKCVVPGGAGRKKLIVQTSAGRSNRVWFEIKRARDKSYSLQTRGGGGGGGRNAFTNESFGDVGYFQPIRFAKTFLKKGRSAWKMPQLTSVALGPDDRYYFGSLNGYVHVVRTDFSNQIKSHCQSKNVGRHRSVLGVAFNPAQPGRLRLYATTSVLYWRSKNLLPFREGWANGQVIAMQKTKAFCLARVGTIVSGLPVSNYDHSVNSLAFDHAGRMLTTVGCTTNAGVSKPDDPLGGIPDSPLSGSVIIANVLKKGFNGQVKYNQYRNPATAHKIGGDVSVFAAGVRNSFGLVVHSNGFIYATDNGANPEFGAQSKGCRSEGAALYESDTLKKIRKGGFYGYANRNRGRWDKRQCKHRPPGTKGKGFDKPIAMLEPSTNGLIEYTANTFGAQLRGDLLATKLAVWGSGSTYRMQLNKDGNDKSVAIMSYYSGLSVAMTPTGGLMMPRVYQGKVAMLIPLERNPKRLIVTSVNPFRGPRRGGNTVTVTGWNLIPPLTVTIGGKPCKNVKNFSKGRKFTCTVPRGSGKAAVVVRRFEESSQSYGFEYMYLTI